MRQFKGLSATKKAKEVCAGLPEIKTLSDFEEADPSQIPFLLDRMKWHSDPPSAKTLGYIGNEHLKERFTEFYGELLRFGYKKIAGILPSGLPYVFEFAVAETDDVEGTSSPGSTSRRPSTTR